MYFATDCLRRDIRKFFKVGGSRCVILLGHENHTPAWFYWELQVEDISLFVLYSHEADRYQLCLFCYSQHIKFSEPRVGQTVDFRLHLFLI